MIWSRRFPTWRSQSHPHKDDADVVNFVFGLGSCCSWPEEEAQDTEIIFLAYFISGENKKILENLPDKLKIILEKPLVWKITIK